MNTYQTHASHALVYRMRAWCELRWVPLTKGSRYGANLRWAWKRFVKHLGNINTVGALFYLHISILILRSYSLRGLLASRAHNGDL